ncbi:MAG: hypothetical protein M0Q91_09865 [Methanoregula sp.]|jgi:hypothetical protein|nr:hypothetical protein [Methanoregula sp.]
MEKNIKILLVLGAIITIILLFIDFYLAGIVCVIFITLLMSFLIMQDSRDIPHIIVSFSEDVKSILLTNKGNAKAVKIHAALVPLNIEFDIPVLEEESSHEIPLNTMVGKIKIILTYENEKGQSFSRSARLSALNEEPDLLKPEFPLFKWKK